MLKEIVKALQNGKPRWAILDRAGNLRFDNKTGQVYVFIEAAEAEKYKQPRDLVVKVKVSRIKEE